MSAEEAVLVEESNKTKKIRAKLLKKHECIEKQITTDALKEKSKEIHSWISRHAHSRIVLKDKEIHLFDENKNTAEESKKVLKVAQKIKENAFSIFTSNQ